MTIFTLGISKKMFTASESLVIEFKHTIRYEELGLTDLFLNRKPSDISILSHLFEARNEGHYLII